MTVMAFMDIKVSSSKIINVISYFSSFLLFSFLIKT